MRRRSVPDGRATGRPPVASHAILGRVTAPFATDETRVDRWLCAVRLVKTRPLATRLCDGGHVLVNGSPAKPSTKVRAGDRVEARIADRERIVEVVWPIDRVSGPPSPRPATWTTAHPSRRNPGQRSRSYEGRAGRASACGASWSACAGLRTPERLRSGCSSWSSTAALERSRDMPGWRGSGLTRDGPNGP